MLYGYMEMRLCILINYVSVLITSTPPARFGSSARSAAGLFVQITSGPIAAMWASSFSSSTPICLRVPGPRNHAMMRSPAARASATSAGASVS